MTPNLFLPGPCRMPGRVRRGVGAQVVDPSHAARRRGLVLPLSLAGVGAGADGLMVEVHPEPLLALCDGDQAIETRQFGAYMQQVRSVARALGRRVPGPARRAPLAPARMTEIRLAEAA